MSDNTHCGSIYETTGNLRTADSWKLGLRGGEERHFLNTDTNAEALAK
jgi:hypothetical protein